MFDGFANVWTAVTLARRLGRKKPLAVRLAGEKVVFFRGADGQAAALLDRCPHRGVSLSLGKVTERGCLECPFHGWQFDGDGRAVHVPLNPDAKKERLGAGRLPVREAGGLLWIHTAPGADPADEPALPPALVQRALALTYLEVEWKAHWTRAMENMLDSPHVPFLHRRTIGRSLRPLVTDRSKMNVWWTPTPFGMRARSLLEGEGQAGSGTLLFHRPNVMVLEIPIPERVFKIHAICVPVDAEHVRMIIVGARSFATSRWLNPLFNWANARIAAEDRAVVESSFPVEVPPAREEASVATDRVTLHFRRYYFEALRPSSAGTPRPREVVKLPSLSA